MCKIRFVRCILAFALLLMINFSIWGQEKKIVYQLPSDYYSLLLVEDSKCPIQLLNPKVYGYGEGRFSRIFSMKNRSNKNIQSFVIKEINWFLNEEITKYPEVINNDFIKPNELFSSFSDEEKIILSPFDNSKAEKLQISKHPKRLYVVMITDVKFSDGTTYSVKPKYNLIYNFIDSLKISGKMSEKQIKSQERKLKKFIIKTLS